MLPGFHGLDLIVILVIALLIFGPKKLPEMGSAVGKSIKEFRKGMHELTAHKDEELKMPNALNLEALERDLAMRRTVSAEVPPIEAEVEQKVEQIRRRRTVSAEVPPIVESTEPKVE